MYFIFSNNTQTILAMGLGTCQKKNKQERFYAENGIRLPAISTSAPVIEEPHTVLLERQL